MLSRILAIVTLAAFVLLSAILQSTSPSTIHPIGILFVLILFYMLVLGVLTFFMYWVGRAMVLLPWFRRSTASITVKRVYYYATVLALAPVLLVGMRSIGRGSVGDVALIAIFEIVACFYIAKRR